MRGPELLAALKYGTFGGSPNLDLRAGDQAATLRPVSTRAGFLDERDVLRLTEWRNRNVHVFLTEFQATPERTAGWLTGLVGPDPGRIIFMLDDEHGRTVGYLGLAHVDWSTGSFEADGIVRGEDGLPGGMSAGLRVLISWAVEQVGLAQAKVRVRSDNPRAVDFYRRLGFVEDFRRPLSRIEEPGMVRWVEMDGPTDEPPDGPHLIHMFHLIQADT